MPQEITREKRCEDRRAKFLRKVESIFGRREPPRKLHRLLRSSEGVKYLSGFSDHGCSVLTRKIPWIPVLESKGCLGTQGRQSTSHGSCITCGETLARYRWNLLCKYRFSPKATLGYLKDFCYEFRGRRVSRLFGRDETLKR